MVVKHTLDKGREREKERVSVMKFIGANEIGAFDHSSFCVFCLVSCAQIGRERESEENRENQANSISFYV